MVTDSYRYTAYGRQLNITGSSINPYRYGGRYGYYTDLNLKVIAAGQRYYAPELYRWLTRDPIKYDGGDNVYAYVKGNPVKFVDPDGLEIEIIGFNRDEMNLVNNVIRMITSTKKGRSNWEKIVKRKLKLVISPVRPNDSNQDSRYNSLSVKGNKITEIIYLNLDPKLLLFSDTKNGSKRIGLVAILAHEIGHALGCDDDGPNRMNNVNANENPVTVELGEKPRIKY